MFIDLYGIRSFFFFRLGQPNRNGKNVLSDHFSSKRKNLLFGFVIVYG